MKNSLTNPRSAAIISFLICLPFACLFALLVLNLEPNFGPLEPLLNNPNPDQPNVLISLIALGTVLLVFAAFVINLVQIVQSIRAGGGIMTHPANLILAVATLTIIVMVVGGIVVDQYPCWTGVPNCD